MSSALQAAFAFPPPPLTAWDILIAEEELLALGFRPGWVDGNGLSFLSVDDLPDEWWVLTDDGEAFSELTLEALLDTARLLSPHPKALAEGDGPADALEEEANPPPPPSTDDAVQGKLVAVPLTLTKAKEFCKTHHSHLKPPQGGLMAVGVGDSVTGELHCVAVIGRPVARAFNGRGIAEITRVASDGRRHASSKAIGLATRLALLQGYKRVVSYTLAVERGTSYRAAGWKPVAISRGGQWGRSGRERVRAEQSGQKIRWEVGPEALPIDPELDARLKALPKPGIEPLPLSERCEGGSPEPRSPTQEKPMNVATDPLFARLEGAFA